MSTTILIDATHQTQELRVARVDVDTKSLLDLLVERQSYVTKTGNIYMGTITAIEPSLDACFVNYGSERHGFLPFKEIVPSYYTHFSESPNQRPAIKDALKIGQKVMVQVEKEERGNKGAALTTYISLAGSYLVLMPNNPRAGGISRRVEGDDRDELREILSSLPIPEEMGLIVRTAGVGKASTELQWDLSTLLKQWEAIQKAAADRSPPFLIHQESDILVRAIRDYLKEDVTEILVDDSKVFERVKGHLEQIRPDLVRLLKRYTHQVPLFSRYQIEHQIEAAHEREVRLPSGGSIVIGHTEALVAIDVNSGQATKGKDIEQTAFEINKEAARVIACQLRLRDIGGLIVIDFIDMPSMRHRREVEAELKAALKLDKARTQVGVISPRFGLLEMSRQRLRHSLGEATRTICPRCDGWGSIRSIESLALSILRMIEEEAIRPGTVQVQAQLPVDLATFLINEKREHVIGIEKSRSIQILIIPNASLEAPHYRIRRMTAHDSMGLSRDPSYRLVDLEEPDAIYKKTDQLKPVEEKPAVSSPFAAELGGKSSKKPASGLIKRLMTVFLGAAAEEESVSRKDSVSAETPRTADRSIDRRPRQSQPPSRGMSRHSHSQARKPRGPGATGKKPPFIPATPADDLRLPPPSSLTGGDQRSARPRRGSRSAPTGQKRAISPPLTAAPKTESPEPPHYLRPSLSDTDLEAYYQDSLAFTHKKATHGDKKPVKPLGAVVDKRQGSGTEGDNGNVALQSPVAQPSVSTENPPVGIAQKDIRSEVKTEIKAIVEDKDWMPHKIASAPKPVMTEDKEKE